MASPVTMSVLQSKNTWAVVRIIVANVFELQYLKEQSKDDRASYKGKLEKSLYERLLHLVIKGRVWTFLVFSLFTYMYYHVYTLHHYWNAQSEQLKQSGSLTDRLLFLFTDPSSQEWSTLEIVAMFSSMIGSGLRIGAQFALGRFFTWELTIMDDHKLKTNGVYTWLRHPSYTGTIGIFGGDGIIPAILHGWYLLGLWTSFVLISILIRIPEEDAVLLQHFGEECAQWHRRSWRLIPLIW